MDSLAEESGTLWKRGRRQCLLNRLAQSNSLDAECLNCVSRCAPLPREQQKPRTASRKDSRRFRVVLK